MLYLILKAVHVAAVVVFLGNITVGILWKRLADRTKDAAIVAFALNGIIVADRVFTIPGVVVLVGAGIATALAGGIPILGTGWLLWGIALISLSGLAFGPVARAQQKLLALARQGLASEADRAQYAAISHSWDLWGGFALLTPAIALVLMILKPDLPAFHR